MCIDFSTVCGRPDYRSGFCLNDRYRPVLLSVSDYDGDDVVKFSSGPQNDCGEKFYSCDVK